MRSSCLNYHTVLGTGSDFSCSNQGRCRVFEISGKIDLGEHKRPPHVDSVCETSPEKKILTASLCVLNSFFAESGTIFQSFLVTIFLSKNARNNLPS